MNRTTRRKTRRQKGGILPALMLFKKLRRREKGGRFLPMNLTAVTGRRILGRLRRRLPTERYHCGDDPQKEGEDKRVEEYREFLVPLPRWGTNSVRIRGIREWVSLESQAVTTDDQHHGKYDTSKTPATLLAERSEGSQSEQTSRNADTCQC